MRGRFADVTARLRRAVSFGARPEDRVIQEVSPSDAMWGRYAGAAEHYASVGRSALACIRVAMMAAGKEDARRILDLPCGHGRVLRHLKAAFPEAGLTACDVDRDGVDFCARVFGATPAYSDERPERIRVDGRFDLIWCGSLLTHLPAERWHGFLELFSSLLSPAGLVVFTTLGRFAAAWIDQGLVHYGLGADVARRLAAGCQRDGFAYADYPHATGYGLSLASPSWVVSRVAHLEELRLVHYSETAWDDHQDVVACVRMDGRPREADHLAGRHGNVLRILREMGL
jgi:SAM-dependent methyltransferase